MILVHRVKGGSLYVNCDLIESIESTPDTVITLANGHRMLASDPPDRLVQRIRDFRGGVLAAADDIRSTPTADLIILKREEA